MASVFRHSSRNGWQVQLCLFSGLRVVLWLGPVTKSGAQYAGRQVEQLAAAAAANVQPPAEALKWAQGCSARIRARLAEWGLIPAESTKKYTLRQWIDDYIAKRTDVKQRTRVKWGIIRESMLSIMADKDLRSYTVADARHYARTTTGRDSTVGTRIKVAKQFFQAAIEARIITENPFLKIAASSAIDESRSAYVDAETYTAVFAKIATAECRLAFCLARYAGLRIPSELLLLEWQHIDWEAGSMLIHSPKTERYAHRRQRKIPLFPTIRSLLEQHWQSAPEGSKYVLSNYRDSAAKTFRKQLLAAIAACELSQWEKLFVNLRASCRTDLEEQFPIHVCDYWLGHSNAVARKHYKRVTKDHIDKANGAVAGAVTPSQTR